MLIEKGKELTSFHFQFRFDEISLMNLSPLNEFYLSNSCHSFDSYFYLDHTSNFG